VLKFGGHVAFVGFQVAVFGVVALARCAIGTAYQMATYRLGRFRELHLARRKGTASWCSSTTGPCVRQPWSRYNEQQRRRSAEQLAARTQSEPAFSSITV
jgi:hypothetical protein